MTEPDRPTRDNGVIRHPLRPTIPVRIEEVRFALPASSESKGNRGAPKNETNNLAASATDRSTNSTSSNRDHKTPTRVASSRRA
jgi:hypothetical protein